MPRRIIYRRQLLRAVEAFLEGTPSSYIRAQHSIQRCVAAMRNEAKGMTIDNIIWGFFIQALTDSVYYESETFLRDTHEILLGQLSRNTVITVFRDDCRVYFTDDETEWYAQLVSMGDFLTSIPFAKLHKATYQAMQSKENREALLANIPEAVLVEKIEKEYLQRKELIEKISARSPSPENVGDEQVYRFVLREVTSLLTEITVGRTAVYVGYPILGGPHSIYGGLITATHKYPDVTESLLWAKRILEAIVGKGELFISWRLSKAATFDGDLLIISLH